MARTQSVKQLVAGSRLVTWHVMLQRDNRSRRKSKSSSHSLTHWHSNLLLRLYKIHQLVQGIDVCSRAADHNIFVRSRRRKAALCRSSLPHGRGELSIAASGKCIRLSASSQC